MRVTAAFSRLLDLPGVWVKKVRFEPGRVMVWVALRRKRLCCPKCSYGAHLATPRSWSSSPDSRPPLRAEAGPSVPLGCGS
jgi:hypothetical protein